MVDLGDFSFFSSITCVTIVGTNDHYSSPMWLRNKECAKAVSAAAAMPALVSLDLSGNLCSTVGACAVLDAFWYAKKCAAFHFGPTQSFAQK